MSSTCSASSWAGLRGLGAWTSVLWLLSNVQTMSLRFLVKVFVRPDDWPPIWILHLMFLEKCWTWWISMLFFFASANKNMLLKACLDTTNRTKFRRRKFEKKSYLCLNIFKKMCSQIPVATGGSVRDATTQQLPIFTTKQGNEVNYRCCIRSHLVGHLTRTLTLSLLKEPKQETHHKRFEDQWGPQSRRGRRGRLPPHWCTRSPHVWVCSWVKLVLVAFEWFQE